ncbi:MFS transporter [Bifidobacterium aquikefiri]|uniref:MFS transporter n=1 Tax=Bifidobacterium aquikefiri TaxID=1653207 RepID=UPI0039E8AA3D
MTVENSVCSNTVGEKARGLRLTASHSTRVRLNSGKTFAIGFGMFAISAAWALYNAYVPLKLKDFALPTILIGLIMAIDNICALTIQPLFGILSDSVRTRWGRRLPFAMFLAPICAVALCVVGISKGVAVTVLSVVVYAVLMSMWRAPIVALMPDVTPSSLRSKANGIINLMGSIGAVIALVGGSMLLKRYGMSAAFASGAIIIVIAIVALITMVREPKEYCRESVHAAVRVRPWIRFKEAVMPKLNLNVAERRSFMLIMLTIFSYTIGINALETYFTLYATHDLRMRASAATGALACYAAGSIVFAVIAGIIATHLGRKRTMSIGLILAILAFLPMPWIGNRNIVIPAALLFGMVLTLVLVNALPWIAELGGRAHTGTMTAYYYLATSAGAVISPVMFGAIQQWTGEYRWIFTYAAVFFIAALVCMPFIQHGEVHDEVQTMVPTRQAA